MNKNLKNMIIIFIGFFFLSLFSNTLSPFITTIKATYKVSNDLIAILPSVVYCASFIMSILGAKLMIDLGLKKSLRLGFIFAILASLTILFSKSFYVLLVGYFLSGLAVGMGSLILNTYISMLPKDYQKFSLANACFGLGGILIQPIDRFVLRNQIGFSYTYIMHIVTVCLFLLLTLKLDSIPIEKNESENTGTFSILKNPMVLLLSISIFFYVGAEISTTNWTGNFLEKYYGLSKAEVPNILLGFWILFTLGRALGDKFLDKVGQLKFLSISPLISIIGIFVILSGKTELQAITGVAIIGITISLIYPAIQGYIIQHVSKKDIPSASSIIAIFNNLGATFLTYLIGFAGGMKITYVFMIQIFFYAYIILVSVKYLIFNPKNIKA
ncbi:MFS transporter [Clostridium guangxiense]|uniref:MFS transporter n=1 Tax=Clostridium guangxiense TaxID=1662055 RepID=UPI001E58778E|nr:MFS transporter [Clostridium guangxiense]MCD2345457.1 MFS transporter [Clostridium guangxiense]